MARWEWSIGDEDYTSNMLYSYDRKLFGGRGRMRQEIVSALEQRDMPRALWVSGVEQEIFVEAVAKSLLAIEAQRSELMRMLRKVDPEAALGFDRERDRYLVQQQPSFILPTVISAPLPSPLPAPVPVSVPAPPLAPVPVSAPPLLSARPSTLPQNQSGYSMWSNVQ
jgi:hypothetical protein